MRTKTMQTEQVRFRKKKKKRRKKNDYGSVDLRKRQRNNNVEYQVTAGKLLKALFC